MPFSYQEARTFNESPVNPRKCNAILTKILYLLNQGEVLGTTEATECFFAITKLFQEKDKVRTIVQKDHGKTGEVTYFLSRFFVVLSTSVSRS